VSGIVPAFKVHAIDTTAAGDTFLGSFSSELKPDLSNLKEAIMYGNKASSLAVQKMGAQPSIPTRKEVLK
jgi:ribokinase